MYEPESPAADPASHDAVDAPIPGLFHLTGSRRGTTETLVEDVVRIGSGPDNEIHLPADREPAVASNHATLHRRGQTYQLRAEPGQQVFVNDDPVDEWVLAAGDVMRIGAGAVRSELDARVSGTLDRLDVLEERIGAAPRVISTAAESIVFLQGSYGFVEQQSGKPLRFLLGPDGGPVLDPTGMPGITIEGEGPVLESQFTGTGFVATDDGLILTNRHVAMPWDFDDAAKAMAEQGLTPTLYRFVGYLKDVPKPFDLELVAASDDADVAVLRCGEVTSRVRPLTLAETPPAPGDEVIVLGYPTGIRALLARTDVAFVSELMSAGDRWRTTPFPEAAPHAAARNTWTSKPPPVPLCPVTEPPMRSTRPRTRD
ncbi:MAG: FHA domain-containing protein, partial [bacterium]|nr:FHA domain-containing protein [bacterium]